MSFNDHDHDHPPLGGEVVSTEAYFALDINQTNIEIRNADIAAAVSASGKQQCTIEAWVWPGERTDLEDNDRVVIATRRNEWTIGLTGDGRPWCEFIINHTSEERHQPEGSSLQAFAPERIAGGQWHHLAWVLNPDGSICIFDGTTNLLTTDTLSGIQQWSLGGDHLASVSDPVLELGSDSFIGKIRTLMTYRVAKKGLEMEESMYFAQLHEMPKNAEAYINLYHTSANAEDAEDPDSAVPLCCYVTQSVDKDHPKMIEIDLPVKTGLDLVAITPSRWIGPAGYLDCGLGALSDGSSTPNSFTIDTWLMLDSETFLDVNQRKAIFSVGDWSLTYLHSQKMFQLIAKHLQSQWYTFQATSPLVLQIGRWWHVCLVTHLADKTAPTMFINGKKMDSKVIDPGIWPTNSLAVQSQKYNLIIGATFQYTANQPSFPSYDPETKDNWPGYFKLFRIWKRELTDDEVVGIHHLDFEEDDMTLFYGYFDLDTQMPVDLTGRNSVYCSRTTEFVEETESIIPHTPQNNSNVPHHTMPRIVAMRRRDHLQTTLLSNALPMLAAMPMAGAISAERIGLLAVLVSEIFVAVVSVITGAKVKGGLVGTVLSFLKNPNGSILTAIQALVAARSAGVSAVAQCLKQVLVAIYNSGIVKKILQHFTLGFFGLARLLAKLIPGVGTVALLLNLAVAAASIVVAIVVYVQGIAVLDNRLDIVDLDLQIAPDDGSGFDVRFPIKVGADTTPLRFRINCDRVISNDKTYKFGLASVPAGVISISSLAVEFTRNTQLQTITFSVNQKDFLGQARVTVNGGRDLVTFEVVQNLLSTEQNVVVLLKENDTLTASLDSTWNGWLNEHDTFGMRYRFFDTQRREISEEPTIEQLEIYDDGGSSKGKSYTASRRGLNNLRVKMKFRISGSSQFLKLIKGIKAQAAVNNKTSSRTETETEVKRNKIEEIVRIWMIYCGTGDQFYNQFERRELNEKGDVVSIKKAHMIIDGGLGETALNLLTEVPDQYLPPLDPISQRRKFDLSILTHYDADHAIGLRDLYQQFASKKVFYPGLTWMNASSAAQATTASTFMNAFSSMSIASPIATEGLHEPTNRPASDEDVPKDHGHDLPAAEIGMPEILSNPGLSLSSSGEFPTMESTNYDDNSRHLIVQPWPQTIVGIPAYGDSIVDTCHTQGYPVQFCPAITSVPQAFKDASAIITYKGPNKALTDELWKNNMNGIAVNRASIVHTMESVEIPQAFSALWTGDAHDMDVGGRTDLRNALGLGLTSYRHFTFLKVGHHGSQLSNCVNFFKQVTADYYMVSAHGKHHLPTELILNAIFAGYNERRLQIVAQNAIRIVAKQELLLELDLAGPRVYISAPLPSTFRIDTKGGHLYYRNQTDALGREARRVDPKKGSLLLTFVNGILDATQSAQKIDTPKIGNSQSYLEFPSTPGPSSSSTKRSIKDLSLLTDQEKQSYFTEDVKDLLTSLAWAAPRIRISVVDKAFNTILNDKLTGYYLPVENLAAQRSFKSPHFVIWASIPFSISLPPGARIVSIHSTNADATLAEPDLKMLTTPYSSMKRFEYNPQHHIVKVKYWMGSPYPFPDTPLPAPIGIELVEQDGSSFKAGIPDGKCIEMTPPGPDWALLDFWGYLYHQTDLFTGTEWDLMGMYAPVWGLISEFEDFKP